MTATVSPGGVERLVQTCMGTVTIDGISMHRRAWELIDLTPLFADPAQRGRNRLMPLSPGTIAYAPRLTETRFSLPLLVCGHWDENDDYVAVADIYEQLELNVESLMTTVLLPTGAGSGTRTFEWTLPSGAIVTSEVQVLPSREPINLGAACQLRTLELLAPDGDLHL